MKGILFAVAAIACISLGLCDDMGNKDSSSIFTFVMDKPADNSSVQEKYQYIDKVLKKISNSATKYLLRFFMKNFGHLNLTNQCVQNVISIGIGLQKTRPWAMRFLDSSGKLMDGLLVVTPTSIGNYKECLDTEVRSERRIDAGKLLYRGQYCLINVVPPLPDRSDKKFITIQDIERKIISITDQNTIAGEISKYAGLFYFLNQRFGVCVPTGCNLEDLNKIVKYAGDMVFFNASVKRCEVKVEKEYTPVITATISVLSFLLFLVLVGTAIDLYKYYTKAAVENLMIRTVLAFSFFTNFQKLIDTKTSSDTLSCIHGIRFLSLSWVVVGHTFLFFFQGLIFNMKGLQELVLSDFAFQAVSNGTVSVDTFFCMGGLLVCYLTIKLVRNEGRKMNIILFIFHRVLRIYPAYILVILSFFLVNLFGDGPVWHEFDILYKNCLDNWWANLLFINNFYDTAHSCIPHSWYVASDFQLYVASLLLLIPMIKRPKVGILLTITAIVACVLYSGIFSYMSDYPPTMLMAHADADARWEYCYFYYFRPFAHVGPYCVGILAGYILATYPKLKIPVVLQVLGWCSAIAINMSVLYGVFEWNKGVEPTLFGNIMYASFNRTAWSLGIAWMIVCCATGHGGVVNYILSWKMFIPLSRLSYIAYLLHMTVILLYMGSSEINFPPNYKHVVYAVLGNFFFTYCGAFVASMLIESPCMAIQKIFLPAHQSNSEKNNDATKEINKINGTLGTNKNGDIEMIPSTDEGKAAMDKIVYNL